MSIVSRISRPRAAIGDTRELERQIRFVCGGGLSATGIAVNSETAMRVGAVYSCVLVLAQSVAQLPLHLFERMGEKKRRVQDHYLTDLVCDEPNEWMTDFDMRLLVMVHLLLRGNSLWFKVKNRNDSRIRELIPIHPDLIHGVKQDDQYRIIYDIRRPKSGIVDTIPADKILHFRGLSMDGFWGANPIEKAREMIGLSLAAEKHGAKLFSNGAQIGKVFKHPQKISKDAYDRLKLSLEEATAGVENAHKTLLIEEGMDIAKIGMTAEESQFLESRKFSRSEIAGWFRVPSHLINDLEKATFSNVEHLDLSFVKHTLMPWLVSIEKTFRKSLMTPEEKRRYRFRFNVDGLQRGDLKSRSEAQAKAILGGWLSPNEVREMEDRNPYEGGDEFRVPLNTEPAGGKADEPKEAAED